jgi:serine/threonine protein kinase
MSWFKTARDLVVRWGKPVRFAAKHVIIAAVPGGSLVADMVDQVLECVRETAEDQEKADARIRSQLNDQELQQIAGILAECNGQLAGLMQQLVALDGLPDAADRIIRMQRATEERIQAGFANLARFAEQFDRIEAGVGRVEAKVDRIEDQIRQLAERNHVRGGEARKLTVSITNEKEREVLRKLRDEYRKLPPEQQNVESLTLLADSLSAAGQFSQAQEMHAEAALRAAAENKSLAAKNHYQRYRDACELGHWQVALDALLEAARLDPAYRPFSLVQYVPKMILGTGGFGTVLRCEDQYAVAEERAVAVKTLHTADLACEVREVFAEAHIIKTLKHPAIIGVRAWGCFDDDEARPFIVMEYFEGDSLAKHLRQQGKLDPAEAVAIARQVASGMSAAHKARVYHRDLKPENILVRKTGASWEVRLIDFGLAVRQHAAGKSVLCPPDSRSASDRSYAGTFKYAPPEQKNEVDAISGKIEKVGPYSDVYTFGKTFCEALFGTTAPKGFHYDKLPENYQPLRDLLERCTADAVEERFSGFGEVLAKLDALDPRRREGEALLVQRYREILEHTLGKLTKDDMAPLGKLCKEYSISMDQRNAIVAQERKRWDASHLPMKDRQPAEEQPAPGRQEEEERQYLVVEKEEDASPLSPGTLCEAPPVRGQTVPKPDAPQPPPEPEGWISTASAATYRLKPDAPQPPPEPESAMPRPTEELAGQAEDRERQPQKSCPTCEATQNSRANFCKNCGEIFWNKEMGPLLSGSLFLIALGCVGLYFITSLLGGVLSWVVYVLSWVAFGTGIVGQVVFFVSTITALILKVRWKLRG